MCIFAFLHFCIFAFRHFDIVGEGRVSVCCVIDCGRSCAESLDASMPPARCPLSLSQSSFVVCLSVCCCIYLLLFSPSSAFSLLVSSVLCVCLSVCLSVCLCLCVVKSGRCHESHELRVTARGSPSALLLLLSVGCVMQFRRVGE